MRSIVLSVLIVGTIGVAAVFAATPPAAPNGTMGMCNDGTYSASAEKKGACRGHKGVKEWYEGTAAAPSPATNTAPAAPAAPMTTTRKTSATSVGVPTARQVGGGAGQVWANDSTKVYHGVHSFSVQ